MAKKFKVELPEKSSLDHRRLDGVGLLLRGEPQELSLTEHQVKSLEARGIEVNPLAKKKKIKDIADEDASSGKENE